MHNRTSGDMVGIEDVDWGERVKQAQSAECAKGERKKENEKGNKIRKREQKKKTVMVVKVVDGASGEIDYRSCSSMQ